MLPYRLGMGFEMRRFSGRSTHAFVIAGPGGTTMAPDHRHAAALIANRLKPD
jgi:hypothetical protein